MNFYEKRETTTKLPRFDLNEAYELLLPQTGGTITWGEGFSPGVYFIKFAEGREAAQKVVLVR